MEFDRFTVVFLTRREDAPKLSQVEEDALQDAHLDFLAKLHEAGHVVAAGPLVGPEDRRLRGITIMNVSPEEARRLNEEDPAARAGRFAFDIYPWLVPRGAISFRAARFPHSMADVEGP